MITWNKALKKNKSGKSEKSRLEELLPVAHRIIAGEYARCSGSEAIYTVLDKAQLSKVLRAGPISRLVVLQDRQWVLDERLPTSKEAVLQTIKTIGDAYRLDVQDLGLLRDSPATTLSAEQLLFRFQHRGARDGPLNLLNLSCCYEVFFLVLIYFHF